MRRKLVFLLSLLVAMAVAVLLPWLAYDEAQRQARAMEADRALGAARDALHRSDAGGTQVMAAIKQLTHSPHAPCSLEDVALMREIDLSYNYIEAIGRERDGVVLCSSLGSPRSPSDHRCSGRAAQ